MAKFGNIIATASCLPKNVVTNDQLSEIMNTSNEWIYSRTGIRERRIATEENTSDLCSKVAKKLLKKTNVSPNEIDFIIIATMSPDYVTPSTACLVQSKIGANMALAFDISAACSGFVYGLSIAEKLIRTGSNMGIVIGGEVISKILNWNDRSTAVLFGDGAGGVLLRSSHKQSIFKENFRSDGTRSNILTSGYINSLSPYQCIKDKPPFLTMSGKDIFDFVIKDVWKSIEELIKDEKVDYFLLHQANARILDIIAKKLQIPRKKFLQNISNYANTSAATIPILLDETISSGLLNLGKKQKIVLSGFGGGLTWGNILLHL